jgi:hypothetical protein
MNNISYIHTLTQLDLTDLVAKKKVFNATPDTFYSIFINILM